MNSYSKKVITHAAGFAVGILLAISIGSALNAAHEKTDSSSNSSSKTASSERNSNRDASRTSGREKQGRDNVTSYRRKEFQAAWDAIGFRNVTIAERLALQREVLAKWSMTDLEGAMTAALSGPWDGGEAQGGIDALMSSFEEAFKKQPLAAWDLIQSGKLGPGSALFREPWLQTAAGAQPLLVISLLGSMSQKLQLKSIGMTLNAASGNPEMRTEILKKIGELPPTANTAGLIAEAYRTSPSDGNPSELRDKLAAATGDQERTMALHEYASSLRNTDAATLRDEWNKLPPELQGRAAIAFFNSPTGVKNAPDILDFLMKSERWDVLRDPTAQNNLRQYAREGNGSELAAWGLTLPERAETVEIFRRAVDPYISRNIQDAKNWIQTLPAGDWRTDRAYAQFSQHALYGSKDAELSGWALDRITDPQIKAEATRWRSDWAKRRGVTEN